MNSNSHKPATPASTASEVWHQNGFNLCDVVVIRGGPAPDGTRYKDGHHHGRSAWRAGRLGLCRAIRNGRCSADRIGESGRMSEQAKRKERRFAALTPCGAADETGWSCCGRLRDCVRALRAAVPNRLFGTEINPEGDAV